LVTATEGVESVHTTGTPNVVPQTTKSASVGGSGEATGEAEDSSSKYVLLPLTLPILLLLLLSLVVGVKLTKQQNNNRSFSFRHLSRGRCDLYSPRFIPLQEEKDEAGTGRSFSAGYVFFFFFRSVPTSPVISFQHSLFSLTGSFPLIELPFAPLRKVLMTDHMMAQRDWEY
jgi:hypothetical protein